MQPHLIQLYVRMYRVHQPLLVQIVKNEKQNNTIQTTIIVTKQCKTVTNDDDIYLGKKNIFIYLFSQIESS